MNSGYSTDDTEEYQVLEKLKRLFNILYIFYTHK